MTPSLYATLPSGERIKIGEVVEGRLANTAPMSFPPPLHEIAPTSVAMQFTGTAFGMSSRMRALLRGIMVGIGRSKRSRENTRRRRDAGRQSRHRRVMFAKYAAKTVRPEYFAIVHIGPVEIDGADARAVPSPSGIPTDVDVPMGFIYRPDDET